MLRGAPSGPDLSGSSERTIFTFNSALKAVLLQLIRNEAVMKISYNWLKQYIDTDLAPQQISEILTNTGLEVEGLEEVQSVKGGLQGVIIGEVLSCEKHPDADKLTVCKVNLGEGEPVQIICGAPNVAAGQKVPVATVGTTLWPDDKGFTIKKARIRGTVSMGMICAEDELGLGSSHEGIMVLDPGAEPGTPAADYFQVENDYVFEIKQAGRLSVSREDRGLKIINNGKYESQDL